MKGKEICMLDNVFDEIKKSGNDNVRKHVASLIMHVSDAIGSMSADECVMYVSACQTMFNGIVSDMYAINKRRDSRLCSFLRRITGHDTP